VFVHASVVPREFAELARGQRVEYEVGVFPKTGREAATKCVPLDPIISPRRAVAMDELPPRDIAEAAFMRRPS
jgi:hypothetical protein